jgi:RCR-type E3 ubiquitin transferase
MRLRYEGLEKCEEISDEGSQFFEDPAGYAMDRYAYYTCFKCEKPYFGGLYSCVRVRVRVIVHV